MSADLTPQDALATEVQAVTSARPVSGDDLGELDAIHDTVKEAIRLLPPAPVFDRQAAGDDTLGGDDIKAGTSTILCPLTQNDPRWFPNPERFDPSRWRTAHATRLPRLACFPFGGGRRIGMQLAMMEPTLVLAERLRRHRITRTEQSALSLMPAITLSTKAPLKLLRTPR